MALADPVAIMAEAKACNVELICHKELSRLQAVATASGDGLQAVATASGDGLQAVASASDGMLRYATIFANMASLFAGFQAVLAETESLSDAEAEARIHAYAESHRDAPLRALLNTGGYYVKVGQLLSCVHALPQPWMRSLRSLQRDVPPRPRERLIATIESESKNIRENQIKFAKIKFSMCVLYNSTHRV